MKKDYLKYIGKKDWTFKGFRKKNGKYPCLCDCGNQLNVSTYNLTRAINT